MSTTFSKKFLPFILPNGIIYLRMIYPRNPVRPAGNSGKLHSAEVTMSTLQIVLLVILVILIIALVLLYRYGNKMQKLQAEQQEMLDATKQLATILVIDKKMMKLKDAGLPKEVWEQTPWYGRRSKVPIVKAKIGPRIINFVADARVYQQLPVKAEAKVMVSGIYISEVRSARGGLNPVEQPKGIRARIARRLGRAASRAEANIEANDAKAKKTKK
jgi:hypothetical protein